jgi:hypothetical protein
MDTIIRMIMPTHMYITTTMITITTITGTAPQAPKYRACRRTG